MYIWKRESTLLITKSQQVARLSGTWFVLSALYNCIILVWRIIPRLVNMMAVVGLAPGHLKSPWRLCILGVFPLEWGLAKVVNARIFLSCISCIVYICVCAVCYVRACVRACVNVCVADFDAPGKSQTLIRHQTECPLTNRLSYRGSS